MQKQGSIAKSSSKRSKPRLTRNSNKEHVDAQCPMCMEAPHSAVLLVCSNYDKGCRPFICHTPVQFNCLNQYRVSGKTPKGDLLCPLCRGLVTEEKVVDGAREFLNLKVKSCEIETCDYNGTYKELNGHWWIKHSADNVPRLRDIGFTILGNGRYIGGTATDGTEFVVALPSSSTPVVSVATPLVRTARMNAPGHRTI